MGKHWLGVLLPGLLLAIIALPVGWWLERIRLRKENVDYIYSSSTNRDFTPGCGYKKNARQFVVIILVFLAGIIVLDQYTPFGIITIIPALSLSVPLLWAVGIGEWEVFIDGFKYFFANRLAAMKNLSIQFIPNQITIASHLF